MKRLSWVLGVVIATGFATALAQPPGGPGGRAGTGGPPNGGPPGGRPPMPVIEVLDADRDHVISANELKNATTSLLTLDRNHDGKLTENEFGGQGGGRGQVALRGNGGVGRRPQPIEPAERRPGGLGSGQNGGPPRPDPERMIEHAMEFDLDQDGKLSRNELKKFAEDFERHHADQAGPSDDRPNGPGEGKPSIDGSNEIERPRRPE